MFPTETPTPDLTIRPTLTPPPTITASPTSTSTPEPTPVPVIVSTGPIATAKTPLRLGREEIILEGGFSFKAPDVIPDVLWPQLRRTGKRIKDMFEENDFGVMGWDAWTDDVGKCVVFFELESWLLPRYKKIVGPSIFSQRHTGELISKYGKKGRIWIDGEFWVAEVKRPYQEPHIKMKEFLSADDITLKAKGIASHLAKEIGTGFNVLHEKELVSHVRRYPGFGKLFIDFFEKRVV